MDLRKSALNRETFIQIQLVTDLDSRPVGYLKSLLTLPPCFIREKEACKPPTGFHKPKPGIQHLEDRYKTGSSKKMEGFETAITYKVLDGFTRFAPYNVQKRLKF